MKKALSSGDGRADDGGHGPGSLHHEYSTGKQYAIARIRKRGADDACDRQTSIEKPRFVNIVLIESAREMFEEVTGRAPEQDIIIKAAAVADYCPQIVSDEKVKKAATI